MKGVLKDQYIDYLIGLKPHVKIAVDKNALTVRRENTVEVHFDIVDKQQSIIVGLGQGSASYQNIEGKNVEIIDYENLLNQLDDEYKKGLKRADFILYHSDGKDFFIINELSQSKKAGSKRKDARLQLFNAAKHLMTQSDTNKFISQFSKKLCIFSNKEKTFAARNPTVEAFEKIRKYLDDPKPFKHQQITKLGFEGIETATIEI